MTPETKTKAEAIRQTLINKDRDVSILQAYRNIAELLACLTSANKEEREAGKAYVRDLARGKLDRPGRPGKLDKPFAVD